MDPVRNFAVVTVSAGYDNVATTIGLNSGHSSLLPDPAIEGAFNATWWDSTLYPNPQQDVTREIIRVDSVTGDSLSISRAQESTTANNHNTGGSTYKLVLTFTKKTYDDFVSGILTKYSATGGNATLTSITATYGLFNSLTSNSIKSDAITSISGNIQSLSSTVIIFSDNTKLTTAPIAGYSPNISSATENYIVRWGSASSFTNSLIRDDGNKINTVSAAISSMTATNLFFADNTKQTTATGYRTSHTWAIAGEIKVAAGDTDFICPMFISVPANRISTLVGAKYIFNSGSSLTASIQKNGANVAGLSGLLVLSTAASSMISAVSLIDGDKLGLVINSASGTPKNLSFSIFLDNV